MSVQAFDSIPAAIHAGRVLFGPSFKLDGDWRERLKTAFKKRALETHPDRAQTLGRAAGELLPEFHAVQAAYRFLSNCRLSTPKVARRRPPSARSWARRRPAEARPGRTGVEEGQRPRPPPRAPHTPLPPRRTLRFAEFLYYTGRVSFSELVAALVWQRRQRPSLGQLAVEFGFLTAEQVGEILTRRHRDSADHLLFGQYAVSQGFLSHFQLLAILGRQRRLQRPIGQFFVERGLIRDEEIEEIKRRIFAHNASCAA